MKFGDTYSKVQIVKPKVKSIGTILVLLCETVKSGTMKQISFLLGLFMFTALQAQVGGWKVDVKGDRVFIDGQHVMNITAEKGNQRFAVFTESGDSLIAITFQHFKNPELFNDPANPRGVIRFLELRFIPMGNMIAEIPTPEVYNKRTIIRDLAGEDLIWPGGLDTANVRLFHEKHGLKFSTTRTNLIRRYGLRAIQIPN
jgi:hypothetical protein